MSTAMEGELLQLARRQHGVVASHQARKHGSRAQLHHEFTRPIWTEEAPQVHGLAGAARTPEFHAMVRLLRSGPGAVVSHISALWLWQVVAGERFDPLHVTRIRGSNGVKVRADGVVVHESRKMPPHHVTTHRGFSIVTPARALADVAAREPIGRVERWLDRAWSLRLVSHAELIRVLGDLNKKGRRGIRPMLRLVAQRGPEYVAPESGLESRLNSVLARAGLPGVRRQVELGGEVWLGRVDFLLDGTGLVIEVQSDLYHASLSASADDRRRATALTEAGFTVLAVWESDVWSRPDEVVAAVEAALREAQR